MPANKVSGLDYQPEYAGAAGRTLGDAAYALYRFANLNDYPGTAQIKIGWDPSGDTAQQVFLGLADFSNNRWDWFQFPANWAVGLGSFTRYIDGGGNTIVAVVSLDNGTFKLDYVLAGTNTAPVIEVSTDLDANPLNNIAPRIVSFDATSSRSYGGTLAGFDFDWEGDGTWDVTSNQDGLGIHQFQAGNYQTKIRATDNLSQQSVATLEFTVIDPANAPPQPSFTRTPSSGDGPLVVHLDASASADPGGYITQYEWDFNNDGTYDFASTEPTTEYTFAISGSNIVKLRVTDNFFATATATELVSIAKGWHEVVIENGIETRTRLTTCTTGTGTDARACVAYHNFQLGELRFARAANAAASSWNNPVHPVASSNETGISPSMDVLATNGAPIIAYGEAAMGLPLYVVAATDPTGTSWEAPVLVDASSKYGNNHALRVINTIPSIAAYTSPASAGTVNVVYFTAANLAGTSWNTPVVAIPAMAGIEFRSVTLGMSASGIFKKPIIACSYNEALTPTGTALCSATNIDGTSWNTAVMYPNWSDEGRIIAVNGRPAYCAGTSGYTAPNLFYARANDGNGTSWPANIDDLEETAISADIGVVNDKPLVCFQNFSESKFYLMAATDADGTSWSEPYVIADSIGDRDAHLSMTIVNDQPVICFAYANLGFFSIANLSYY